VENLKEARGWALKNIHVFILSLVTKSLWRLYNECMWGKVIKNKCLSRMSIVDWFKEEINNSGACSTIFKALMKDFPLIGKWSTWKDGRGNSVRIGEDP
jgi:hypothetical protein